MVFTKVMEPIKFLFFNQLFTIDDFSCKYALIIFRYIFVFY